MSRHFPRPALALAVIVVLHASAGAQAPATSAVRLSGLVEAEQAAAIVIPRLRGQRGGNEMVLMRLVPGGSRVAEGEVLIELDPQDQLRRAFDQRADLNDIEGQMERMRGTQAIARSQDDTAITQAENDVSRAKLEVTKNDLIPRVEAEKNALLLEQARARLEQLRETYDLKRTAARADLRILEIRRDRARIELEQAERNASLMTIRAPFSGLVVLKTRWSGGTMVEFQEGDQVRAGQAVLDVIDPSRMRVRAQINQADITRVRVGQPATVRLDAYPELSFEGVVEQIAPLAAPSQRNPRVRSFTAVVSVRGSHPNLLPDLTASVEIAGEAAR